MPSMQLIDNDTELYFSPSAKIASVGAFMQDSDSENNTFVTPSFIAPHIEQELSPAELEYFAGVELRRQQGPNKRPRCSCSPAL